MENRNSQLEHGQPMEQARGLFFDHATRVWLAVNHNTSITSGSKRIARVSELGSCHLNVCNL